jgi:hypothetical protein
MQKDKLRKLRLPKETLLYLAGNDLGQAFGGIISGKYCVTQSQADHVCCA